jgi:hypothetical protein
MGLKIGRMELCGLDRSGSGSEQVESSCKGGNGTLGFHKMLGIYRVVSQLAASRAVLSSMELVRHWLDRVGRMIAVLSPLPQ